MLLRNGERGLNGLLEGGAGISKTDLLLELVTTNAEAGTFSINLQVCPEGDCLTLLLRPACFNPVKHSQAGFKPCWPSCYAIELVNIF